MKISTRFDEETASKWVLHLEIRAEEFASARYTKKDRQVVEEAQSQETVSALLRAAEVIARRVEEAEKSAEKREACTD